MQDSGNMITDEHRMDLECSEKAPLVAETIAVSFKSSSTQCQPIRTRNVKVQTRVKKCTSNKGSQTVQSYKPPTRDIGIQCNLIVTSAQSVQVASDLTTPLSTSTPVKQLHINDMHSSISDDSMADTSSSINDSRSSTSDEHFSSEDESFVMPDANAITDQKYIVFESCLLPLFSSCFHCSGKTTVNITTIGTMLRVFKYCIACDVTSIWDSQPCFGRIPAGNVLLSASILMSGSLPAKVFRLFEFMKCACITDRSFYQHQQKILHPVIQSYLQRQQMSMMGILQVEGNPLVLGGDGRCDSPGFSAKYGSYTFMDLIHNAILHVELVQSNEVKSSTGMEIEGFVRGMKLFEENDLEIEVLVTDRHRQLSKYVRENLPDIDHRYDIWHIAKSFRKKLDKLAKKKEFELIGEWTKSMVNHLYWSAMSSEDGNSQLIREKWLSLVNHIHNVHGGHGKKYTTCSHGHLRRKWFQEHTQPSDKVKTIIRDKQLVKDIEKLSPRFQTSQLESFHSLLNHYAPKQVAFSHQGMLSRLYLAALHYNFNNNREQAKTKSGQKRYKLLFPKYKKGGHIVREVRRNPSFRFVDELLTEVVEYVSCSVSEVNSLGQNIPPPLSNQFKAPDKQEAIKKHTSRFNKS